MAESSRLLEHARRCFELASRSASAKNVGSFAELGREYLRLAHEEAAISEARPKRQAG
jgi:hypothetical protein